MEARNDCLIYPTRGFGVATFFDFEVNERRQFFVPYLDWNLSLMFPEFGYELQFGQGSLKFNK